MSKVNPRHMELAKQIVALARREGWALGHHITEARLTEAFGMSRSPVRTVLKLLADQGILEAKSNRGYFLARDQDDLAGVHLEVPLTDVDAVYLRLVEDRLAGHLPQEIDQKDLLKRYQVNRALLLRAVEGMENAGLLVRNRARGWRFLPVIDNLTTEESSYDFRLMVEPAAIMLPGLMVDYETLTLMRHNHLDLQRRIGRQRLVPSQVFEVDADFHRVIAGFSNNSFVVQAIQQHNRMRRIVEYRGYGDEERVASWIGEHLQIIDVLERRRFKYAAELMATHLANGKRHAMQSNASRASVDASEALVG